MAEEGKKKPKELEKEAEEQAAGNKQNKILIIAVVVLGLLLLIGGTFFGTVFMMMDKYNKGDVEAIDPSLKIEVDHPIKKVLRSSRDPKEMGFEKKGIALYHTIQPTFLVSLPAKKRGFLKVDIVVMARDPNTLAAVKKHEPLIKNDLLALIGAQSRSELLKPEGKEDLRSKAKTTINNVISERSDAPEIEHVLFVNFLVQ